MIILKCVHKVCTIPMAWCQPTIKRLTQWLVILWMATSTGQELVLPQDSILTVNLDEVILISTRRTNNYQRRNKPLATLDEYLESSKKVQMIKRGAYAWEPSLNSMSSERLSITIDGMKIFGACTDKMDPITSYVEVSNLGKASVSSGQQGAKHGTTIGGAIDLELKKSNFRDTGIRGQLETGFESNNEMNVWAAKLDFSNSKFYMDTNVSYRKAGNYRAGGGEEIAFSQFEKYNLAVNSGFKIAENQSLTASLIFDEARDVGYPALPMDVSMAQGIITSLGFQQDSLRGNWSNWNSKLYFNTITHVMDDTKRPNVPIHMDMPGWSETYGFFSEAELDHKKHSLFFKLDGYYNKSLAEMTMYPNDPNELPMFMLTWPDVRTGNAGFFLEDEIQLKGSRLKLATRMAAQNQMVADEYGLNSLRIFYPEMHQSKTRFLKSISGQWHKIWKPWQLHVGLSYGDRAPSVSEGYGFYLYNSFDNHDYIGDPELANEKSMEINAKLVWEKSKFKVSAEANYFHTPDYIIGVVDPSLSVMTIGAEGVKVYRNLEHANLFNTSLQLEYAPFPQIKWNGLVTYHRGVDYKGENLPFISPISYRTNLSYRKGAVTGAISINGAGKQQHYNPHYGEDKTQAYTIFSLSLGKSFDFNNDLLVAKMGVENIFDERYSTFSDWKNIPRMGRNFHVTLSYTIN